MQVKGDTLLQDEFTSWIDDVPTCRLSGIGTATNELYRRDGTRAQRHSFQNRSFRIYEEDYQLGVYGVFQGFQGHRVADFVSKGIPGELILGQLTADKTDDEVKEVLRQAFINVDKAYFESIGELLAKRTVLKSEEGDGGTGSSTILAETEEKVAQGAVGILAVIIKNRLYIASIGDCGALLCRDHEVIPLFCNHTTENEDEILRLCHLGVDVELGQVYPQLGEGRLTRCFGNYLVKGGYKENSLVSAANTEPIIPEPEIFGPIPLDNDVCILLLYTSSLVKAFKEATTALSPEAELVEYTRHYMCEEASLSGVAQAVVDQVVRLHHDRLEVTGGGQAGTLEDMTLLIRDLRELRRKDSRLGSTLTGSSARPTMQSSTTTDSSEVDNTGKELPVDEYGRINPYVDFAPFWKLWNQRQDSQTSLSGSEKN